MIINSLAVDDTIYFLVQYFKGNIVSLKDNSVEEMLRDVYLLGSEGGKLTVTKVDTFMRFSNSMYYPHTIYRQRAIKYMTEAVMEIYAFNPTSLYTNKSREELRELHGNIVDQVLATENMTNVDFWVLAKLLEKSPHIRDCFVSKETRKMVSHVKKLLSNLYLNIKQWYGEESDDVLIDDIDERTPHPVRGNSKTTSKSSKKTKNKKTETKKREKKPQKSFADKMLEAGITDESVMHKTNGIHEHIEYAVEASVCEGSLKVTI